MERTNIESVSLAQSRWQENPISLLALGAR
jgi:hypothetical protein